jgi:hypothetical protein
MIKWLKSLWFRLQYLNNGPTRLPDWFVRHNVRCQVCDNECDIVHEAPNKSSCADGFYCKECEPSVIIEDWTRRIVEQTMNDKRTITKTAWIELEIERRACIMAAKELRKNDGYHMGGKNYKEIIDGLEIRAEAIQKVMDELIVIEDNK